MNEHKSIQELLEVWEMAQNYWKNCVQEKEKACYSVSKENKRFPYVSTGDQEIV